MARDPVEKKVAKKVGGWSAAGVKRPASSYTLFSVKLRADLKAKDSDIVKDISIFSKYAAERWAKMSEKEKAPFVKEASALREAAVVVLNEAKDRLKKVKLAASTKLPSGWKRVIPSDSTKERDYFINKDLGLITFSKPYSTDDAQAHMTKKEKKAKK